MNAVAGATKTFPARCCPDCDSPIRADASSSGYCSCGTPWVICRVCGGVVNPLWRFCPTDKALVGDHIVAVKSGESLRIARSGQRRWISAEPVLQAPVAYAGYLWVLTAVGNLYRISPATLNNPLLIEDLGPGFGARPMSIVPDDQLETKRGIGLPFANPQDSTGSRLIMAVAGQDKVSLLDPAVHRVEDVPSQSPSLSAESLFIDVLSDSGYPSLAGNGEHLAAPISSPSGTAIWLWSHKSGVVQTLPLPTAEICGPCCLGDTLVCYSQTELYWVRNNSLRSSRLPNGFVAATHAGMTDFGLRMAWGRPPFVRVADGLYVPGSLDGKPSLAFVQMSGEQPEVRPKEVPDSTAYRRGGPNSLLLASRGSLSLLKHTAIFPHSDDPQICGEAAVVAGKSAAAHCRTAVGEKELRIYPGGQERIELSDKVIPIDVFFFPSWFVQTFINEEKQLEINSWPLV